MTLPFKKKKETGYTPDSLRKISEKRRPYYGERESKVNFFLLAFLSLHIYYHPLLFFILFPMLFSDLPIIEPILRAISDE